MPGNTAPIYSSKGVISWPTTALITGTSTYDGTGANVLTVLTGDSYGNFVQRLRFKASGSTASAVARVFINDGIGTAAADNFLYDEITLPVVSATNTSATVTLEMPMNFALPPSYKILASITANQNPTGGWYVAAIAGSYNQIS
jgi:hypothetical protein